MPQFLETDEEGWIRDEQLALPRQTLAEGDIESFLDFLFSDVARRPVPLRLREAAAVARYLRTLALEGVPREVVQGGEAAVQQYWRRPGEAGRRASRRLNALAKTIWRVLLQCGEIRPCGRQGALRFLRRYATTYLALRDVGQDLALVEGFEIPPGGGAMFRAPDLMSQTLTVSGEDNPYRRDDLSDRIYAAHHALKRQGVSKFNVRIAEALTRQGVETERRRKRRRAGWTYADVASRVKQAERQLRRQFKHNGRVQANKALLSWAGWRADFWLLTFYRHQQMSQPREP